MRPYDQCQVTQLGPAVWLGHALSCYQAPHIRTQAPEWLSTSHAQPALAGPEVLPPKPYPRKLSPEQSISQLSQRPTPLFHSLLQPRVLGTRMLFFEQRGPGRSGPRSQCEQCCGLGVVTKYPDGKDPTANTSGLMQRIQPGA